MDNKEITKTEWLNNVKMKNRIREEQFIKYDMETKRTVSVDYNWLELVHDDIWNNEFTINEWNAVMDKMLWDCITMKGICEPKVLTINYVCYGEDGKYYLDSKEKRKR
jgi:hypothetical protein